MNDTFNVFVIKMKILPLFMMLLIVTYLSSENLTRALYTHTRKDENFKKFVLRADCEKNSGSTLFIFIQTCTHTHTCIHRFIYRLSNLCHQSRLRFIERRLKKEEKTKTKIERSTGHLIVRNLFC